MYEQPLPSHRGETALRNPSLKFLYAMRYAVSCSVPKHSPRARDHVYLERGRSPPQHSKPSSAGFRLRGGYGMVLARGFAYGGMGPPARAGAARRYGGMGAAARTGWPPHVPPPPAICRMAALLLHAPRLRGGRRAEYERAH